jgi:hypothetical protein
MVASTRLSLSFVFPCTSRSLHWRIPSNMRGDICIFIYAHFYQRTSSTYCKLLAICTVSTKSGTALLVLLVPWHVHARVHLEEVMRAETDTNVLNRHTEKYKSGALGQKALRVRTRASLPVVGCASSRR